MFVLMQGKFLIPYLALSNITNYFPLPPKTSSTNQISKERVFKNNLLVPKCSEIMVFGHQDYPSATAYMCNNCWRIWDQFRILLMNISR
jgi:hypothetical protein